MSLCIATGTQLPCFPLTHSAAFAHILLPLCYIIRCQLALEFSGKATKLYQKHYGDDHEATQRCLDLFTSVYAEVGREEYTSKLSQFETEATDDADHTKDTGEICLSESLLSLLWLRNSQVEGTSLNTSVF